MTIDLDALDPTVNHNRPVAAKGVGRPPRPRSLEGLVLGLLDNRKEQGELILKTFGEVLSERYGVKKVVFERKSHYSKNAPGDLIESMVKAVDVAVVALGG